MKIYLVRHGDYDPNSPEKKLSEQGQRDIHKVGQVLKQAGIFVDQIWHSSKARSEQTAKLLAEQINPNAQLSAKDFLNPEDEIVTMQKELSSNTGDLMVVGHLPFLAKLASALIAGDENTTTVDFQTGSVLLLEKAPNGWLIDWMVIPALI